ncbi:hypothetical protein UFOVP1636_55 [uncultured Caudovirales phage]|uniref:Uncharacterized protein n=1 Tax=uncultured Caudovirales phage TaxID=2100421 RepID=A0A6J5SZJ3_9CAUD|nr:hypothetical protein UFOVP1636_55 [uncultured Caudovirales phage]
MNKLFILSLKQKAALQLIALVLGGMAFIALIETVITYVSRETLVDAMGFGLLGGMLYMGYSLLLARLESQETLKKIEEDMKKNG